VVTGCYIAMNAVYMYVLPIDTVASSTRVAADFADTLLGFGGGALMSGVVMFSTFGALSGIVLAGPRVYYAMAHDRLLFRWVGEIHPRFRTPHLAILLQAVWSSVLVATGTFRTLFTRVIYTEWIFFALLALSLILLRRRHDVRRGYSAWGYPVAPLLFVLMSLAIVVTSHADIPVAASFATYRLSPGHDSCYIEYYYSVSRDSLEFGLVDEDSSWMAQFRAILEITDLEGRPVDTTAKLVATRVARESEIRLRDVKVIDVLRLYLRPGQYLAHLQIDDIGSGRSGRRTDSLSVPDKNRSDSLVLSELQFAYSIHAVNDAEIQSANYKVKNGYYVEPNPSGVYAPEDSTLLLYAELYNLESRFPTYNVHIWVLDRFGGIVKDLGTETLDRPGESALLVYGLRIDNLSHGEPYMLACEVEQGEQVVTARRPFWLGIGARAPVASAESAFTEEDAELNRRLIAYLATSDEMAEYQALGLEGKRRFLDQFWRQRDPEPSTEKNEFFEEHLVRFHVANERFSRSMVQRDDGWNTDRGRVLITYGLPDEIILNPSSIGTWGWERWEYRQIEGGVFFIFLDWKNLGDYRLMHSNKQGERWDPDWQRKIEYEGMDIINR